jgi:hypothetical protein
MRRKKVWLATLIAVLLVVGWASQQEVVQAHVEIWRCQAQAADHYANIANLKNAPTYAEYSTSTSWQCQASVWAGFALAGEPNAAHKRFAQEAIAAYDGLVNTLGQDTNRLARAELLLFVGEEKAALADHNYMVATYDNYWAQEQRAVLHAQFEWLEGGAFMLMRTEIDEPDVPSGIAVFGSDDETGEFFMVYFDERGVSRKYEMSFQDNVWRWWRTAPEMSQRYEGTIADDGNTIIGKGEMSKDGETWQKDLDLTYKRMA